MYKCTTFNLWAVCVSVSGRCLTSRMSVFICGYSQRGQGIGSWKLKCLKVEKLYGLKVEKLKVWNDKKLTENWRKKTNEKIIKKLKKINGKVVKLKSAKRWVVKNEWKVWNVEKFKNEKLKKLK